ncbi:hypothetical protein [Lacrimispora sp.]|uniref:hypothetical protein n=1 Tax=Lacrimispora sp. TaxID=2719234 RepID=UPI0028AB1DC6|nr:hypothetical protein [Lacrimispora sp.]
MTEQELLDMIVLERISALLATQQKSAEEKQKELRLISQAEALIQSLPMSDSQILSQYINYMAEQLAFEEAFLYRHGFIDGIRLGKLFNSL